MTLVALSAAYGTNGSWVGAALADRLGVPFLDRAVPLAVAARLDVSVDVAERYDEPEDMRFLARVLRSFAAFDTGAPIAHAPAEVTTTDFRMATEEVLRRTAADGAGVILGRGSTQVLRDDERVLRVRLHGPIARRLARAITDHGLAPAEAARGLERSDRFHADYLRQFYGADIDDPTLYHLMVDATAFEPDHVVDLIARAAAGVTVS